jgi:trimeric autotransporter adhesin
MNPLTQFKNTTILIALTLASLALAPHARAVCQEGCLTNENTVLGEDALLNNTNVQNTAIGFDAMFSNTTGFSNTATGWRALFFNTTGDSNTATGNLALNGNTTGTANTATGAAALTTNTTGNNNTAIGEGALHSNSIGNSNTALGFGTLTNHTIGNNNIAVGNSAGTNLTSGDNNIEIGNTGVVGEANTIRIGTQGTQTRTFIAGISGATVNGSAVRINGSGKLGVAPSSVRFKQQIRNMDKASEAILALKPVTFRYKKELDPEGIPQFGLVAEEVEKVDPDLVARDDQGKAYTVRYEAVNAMLLNEFLKEHRKGEQQDRKIEELEATIAKQQKQIEALTVGLQKVSAQVELSKRAPRTVLNN